MINYHKYLPVSKQDEDWGLCVLNAGNSRIEPANDYPPINHPDDHYFKWQTGRVLSEYQLIYITKGKGYFESGNLKQDVCSGMILFLFPGERHRYRPCKETGWDEHWLGFKGQIIDELIQNKFFSKAEPCIKLGFNEQVFTLFSSIIEMTKYENTGYQPQISGAILHLLGLIHSQKQVSNNEIADKREIVDRARLLFRSNITTSFTPEQAADELLVSYSYFRKLFKNYTGISPGQYYIQLKIDKAKELLHDKRIPIKSIAYDLQFQSYFYFSKLFKEKTGLTPTAFRKRAIGE